MLKIFAVLVIGFVASCSTSSSIDPVKDAGMGGASGMSGMAGSAGQAMGGNLEETAQKAVDFISQTSPQVRCR